VYDVESVKNYPRVFTEGEDVIVTEKIHGSNARYMFDGKTFWVGSHKKWWKDKANIWWRVAEKYPWIEQFCRDYPKHTLRGEVTPTQTGYQYGATPEEQFFAFDVQKPDGSYIDKQLTMRGPIQKMVPIVYRGPYDAAMIKAMAEGKSLADGAKHIREGIVIASATERQVRGVGRAQLKLKSMAFMEREGKGK
jgi:RNA ligase (TIGR02306 family)